MHGRFSRRNFLSRAGLLAAGIGVGMAADDLERAAGQDAGEAKEVPASEKLVAGFIGMGGMGNSNLTDFMK